MIRFCCTNRLEALLDALADTVGGARTSLFDPVTVIVPNPLIESFVKQGLARRLGIAVNVKSRFLRAFLYDVARASRPDVELVDRDRIEGELLGLFHDPGSLASAPLAAVRDYLEGDGDGLDRKRVQLATSVAALFDEYTFTRPEMLADWRQGGSSAELDPSLQSWQRALWRALHGPGGVFTARGALTLPELFARTPERDLRVSPAHLFGISYVARLYGSIFAKLGAVADLGVYSLSPCHLDRLDEQEGGALDAWARPGRENATMLLELAAGDADARFVDPPGASALATLQRRILERQTADTAGAPDDQSVAIWPALDPRRELETVAAAIWAAVRADETLAFSDFAVAVPAAAAAGYLPLAAEVFEAASSLPCTVLDLPRAGERRIQDAALALLELPLGSLSRPELLRAAMHPAVARRFPDVDPEDWLALCEDLEIVRGADRAALPASYLERDRISWDQGLKRLALGAFLSSADDALALNGEPLLPAPVAPAGEPAARALGILARELIAYADAAQRAPAPFEEHAALLRRVLTSTILPETPEEEAALGDLFSAIERAQAAAPGARPIRFRVAAELIKKRLADGPRVGRPPEGVTVASFVPMRALPFHTIFVVGLDEKVFPAPAGWSPLDLRAGARRAGDVTPREQDQHIFLETLLAARQRVVLSYVARDPVTGDPQAPSPVLDEVRETLGRPADDQVVAPAARHADAQAVAVIPAAARERRAAALGRSLRRASGGAPQLPPLAELRASLATSTWAAIAPDLGWVGAPDGAPASRLRRPLTLTDLRRFLECPLQASARVLLPMRDEGEAALEAEAALRERESLDESRIETIPFLRELASDLLDGDDEPNVDEAYDRAAEMKRMDGTLADGLFGRAARERHVSLLRCWRAGLRESAGALAERTRAIFLGAAPEQLRDPVIRPALALGDLRLGGRTELTATAADGTRLTVSLIGSTNPKADCPERDYLGAFLTHLALTVLDDQPRVTRALTIRPRDDGSPRVDQRRFEAIAPADARAYLTSLATELVGSVHAYFLPCEGVFYCKRHREKGEEIGVRASVLILREDNWTRFASDWGPVPNVREYPVPDALQAEAMAARRFDPYFRAIGK
ncbi:MAG TPA: exodeoxyribonuclease V subunit gamma [Polyangia bacterium]|nr:exodeoxyribonuclease V subunit gamma [Polyangia bacterium]